jgi:fructosamine-3-kinase
VVKSIDTANNNTKCGIYKDNSGNKYFVKQCPSKYSTYLNNEIMILRSLQNDNNYVPQILGSGIYGENMYIICTEYDCNLQQLIEKDPDLIKKNVHGLIK